MLTIESELSRISNVIQFPRVTPNRDPANVRRKITAGCDDLDISPAKVGMCVSLGLDTYWLNGDEKSAIEAGMRLARQLARDNSPPEAA